MRLAIAAVLLIGCTKNQEADGLIGGQLADFLLEDVNATSTSFGDVVSQRSYSSSTAWFFGHST